MSTWLHLLLFPYLAVSTTDCHEELHILELHVKMANEAGSGVNPLSGSTLEVEVRTLDDACVTPFLDGMSGFIPGQVEVFYGDQIGTCGRIALDPFNFSLAIIHGGADDMKIEWVRLVLDNEKYLTCRDGRFIHQARRELNCRPIETVSLEVSEPEHNGSASGQLATISKSWCLVMTIYFNNILR